MVGQSKEAKKFEMGDRTGARKREREAAETEACKAYVVVGTVKLAGLLGRGIKNPERIKTVVFDEVDELMKEKKEDIAKILRLCPNAQPLFVSATMDANCIQRLCELRPHLPTNIIQTHEAARTVLQADFKLQGWEQKVGEWHRNCAGVACEVCDV